MSGSRAVCLKTRNRSTNAIFSEAPKPMLKELGFRPCLVWQRVPKIHVKPLPNRCSWQDFKELKSQSTSLQSKFKLPLMRVHPGHSLSLAPPSCFLDSYPFVKTGIFINQVSYIPRARDCLSINLIAYVPLPLNFSHTASGLQFTFAGMK